MLNIFTNVLQFVLSFNLTGSFIIFILVNFLWFVVVSFSAVDRNWVYQSDRLAGWIKNKVLRKSVYVQQVAVFSSYY